MVSHWYRSRGFESGISQFYSGLSFCSWLSPQTILCRGLTSEGRRGTIQDRNNRSTKKNLYSSTPALAMMVIVITVCGTREETYIVCTQDQPRIRSSTKLSSSWSTRTRVDFRPGHSLYILICLTRLNFILGEFLPQRLYIHLLIK